MSEPVGEARGLTSAEVEQRIATGKVNVNTGIKTKSVRELFAENLFTIFNLINLVLALLVLATGSWKNIGFLGIVVLNTGIGVVQALRSKRMVDKLTLLATKKAVVVRDGVEVELDLEQIVQDDLVKLGRGDQIPADAVVVSGEASVNESLLTGESDLIRKQPGDHLMSGSFLDSGLVFARVEHVGAENYVAKINAQAKYVKKVNSEIMNSLNGIVRFAGVLMIPIGIGLFWASASELQRRAGDTGGLLPWLAAEVLAGRVPSSAILSTVGALLGMIPQGLVLLTSSVLAIATVRLARKKVLAQQLYCIETLARVDVLCLDKTGTITSGHMEVAGTYTLDEVGAAAPAADDAASRRLALALSGVARATAEDANETCQAILAHYASTDLREPCVERVVPFSSAKKWSGASFDGTSFVMGAAQFVLAPEAFARIEGAVSELAQSSRVLVVAEVDGFTEEGDLVGEARPLGLVTIRDEIRSSAAETIGYFKDQGVTLNVISGDDPRTVSGIAATRGPRREPLGGALPHQDALLHDARCDLHRISAVPLRAHPDDAHQLLLHRHAGLCTGPRAQPRPGGGQVHPERGAPRAAGVRGRGGRRAPLHGIRLVLRLLRPAALHHVPGDNERRGDLPHLAYLAALHAAAPGAAGRRGGGARRGRARVPRHLQHRAALRGDGRAHGGERHRGMRRLQVLRRLHVASDRPRPARPRHGIRPRRAGAHGEAEPSHGLEHRLEHAPLGQESSLHGPASTRGNGERARPGAGRGVCRAGLGAGSSPGAAARRQARLARLGWYPREDAAQEENGQVGRVQQIH